MLKGNAGSGSGVIYRTEKAVMGDATLSFDASGVLQPLTTVDVKSKAGGVVTHLAVDEGSIVKAGDLIADIDPRDTQAVFDQAAADLSSSLAKKEQTGYQYQIQTVQSREAVATAESSLASARLKLKNLQDKARIQPMLTSSSISRAQADYNMAVQALRQLRNVTIPQTRAQVKGELDSTKAALATAKANYRRQSDLLKRGFVAESAVEQAGSAQEGAQATYANALERSQRVEEDLKVQQETAQARVDQTNAALDQAKANQTDVAISRRDMQDAKEAVRQATAALAQAKGNRKQVDVTRTEIAAANASIVRSRVSRDNAKVQLDSTTVVAPRAGVVIKKYLEEGTIIPPGASLFSQGTSIVQLADVSTLYVDVLVDEADVSRVRLNQPVRVTLEAAPTQPLAGRVTRVNPSADTTSGVTQVKVRVAVTPRVGVKLMPGLNASCEFILHEARNVLIIPSQAIQHSKGQAFVEVMVGKDKTARRTIKTGAVGNAATEVVEGLKVGDEVVTSKIDMKQIEEQQRKMQEAAQQRNPFTGGKAGGGGGGGKAGGGSGKAGGGGGGRQ